MTAAGTQDSRRGCAVLVARHFVPLNIVASQRALRMARVLLERFDRLYVACDDASAVDPKLLDQQFGRDVLDDPRLQRLPVRALLGAYGYGVANSGVQRIVGGLTTRLLCGPGVDWIRPLSHALAKITEPVRLVVASGPPFITFGRAATFARSRQAPLILDYRDLWTSNPHAPYPPAARAFVNRWIERRFNRSATMITTVSEGCQSSLLANGTAAPVRVLYNTPDQIYVNHYREIVDDWRRRRLGPSERARHHFRIVFTGQVYRNCTFVPLLKAINTLPPAIVRAIEVAYYGDSSVLAISEFEQAGLSNLLADHGKVTKDESLQAMLDADLLLSLIHTDRLSSDPAVTGHMSTKIYDYFLTGIPILNIGPVNAEINRFAAGIGHSSFYTMPADDTAAIAHVLAEGVAGRLPRGEPNAVALPLFATTFAGVLHELGV